MNKNETENIEIDLQELLLVLLHKLWIIILAAAIAGAIALLYTTQFITPMYESTTKVYILSKQNTSGSVTYSDVQLSSTLSSDYEELVTSRSVIEGVIEQLGLDTTYSKLVNRVSTDNTDNTRIIAITVEDADPAQAQLIANELRVQAAKHIVAVMDIEAVNVVDEANYPTSPSSPSIMKNTLIGALIGMILAMAVIVIQHLLDDTIKTSEDIEKYLGLSTLALIPLNMSEIEDNKKSKKAKPVKDNTVKA